MRNSSVERVPTPVPPPAPLAVPRARPLLVITLPLGIPDYLQRYGGGRLLLSVTLPLVWLVLRAPHNQPVLPVCAKNTIPKQLVKLLHAVCA